VVCQDCRQRGQWESWSKNPGKCCGASNASKLSNCGLVVLPHRVLCPPGGAVRMQTVLTTWSGPVRRPAAPRRGAGGGAGAPAAAAAAAVQRREAAAADSLAALAVSCLRELLAAAEGLGGLAAVAWVLRGLPIHSQDTQVSIPQGWDGVVLRGAGRETWGVCVCVCS
jgi:hypothetical protein